MTEQIRALTQLQEQHARDAQAHAHWVAPDAQSETEKICLAINALNRSLDKRLDKMLDGLLLLIRLLEQKSDR